MTKKGYQKFRVLKWKFVPKNVIQKFSPRNFFPSPKLGAKSPPMQGILDNTIQMLIEPLCKRLSCVTEYWNGLFVDIRVALLKFLNYYYAIHIESKN